MTKRTIHGIDITAPGGIEKLFAVHRATFGDAVMEADAEAVAKAAADAKAITDAAAAEAAKNDEKLGEGGIKALQAERARADAAEKRATDLEAEKQKAEDAKLSDIDRVTKERDAQTAETAQLKAENARLSALTKHPVPAEYQDLVTGTDAATFEASAKKISELYARAEGKPGKPSPIPDSGRRSGDDNITGGSIAEHRRQIAERKKK